MGAGQQTKRFLKKNRLNVEDTVEWLQLNGGYCDCEVVWNVGLLFID